VETWTPSDESLLEASCAALEPYGWRSFTPELLARFVVAASDRQSLNALLGRVPGGTVGAWAALEPGDSADPRVAPLVDFLAAHRWTGMRLAAVCRGLLTVLRAT
jgi:hypothetical protein